MLRASDSHAATQTARGFQQYMESLDPQVRARLGQRSYHDLRKAFVSGFDQGLAYADETKPEPNLTPH